jgi:iron complex outermembrane receptor protein
VGNTSNRRAYGASTNRFALNRNPLALACAAAFLLAANASYAQDPAPATTTANAPQTDAEKAAAAKRKAAGVKELDTVKVVGIRKGIEEAIDTKQTSNSIVEAVSAEDIGKLPDSSISESIARLPGLTAQRERGRATQINIRGFNGDFAGATLNGREQTSTGDNRGVEFDQYPSELLSGVVVYKTPDATLVGQGLSGTVDLQTVKPLNFPGRVASMNYRFDQNRNNGLKEDGSRFSFSYIDQFRDRTVGVAIGLAHLDSPQPGYQDEAWGYADGPNGTKVFGGGKLYHFDDRNKRNGLMATLQFKPNDFYETSVDLFYSKFKKTEIKTGVEFGTAWGQGQLQPGYVVNGNHTITDSTWTNVLPVIRMDSNPSEDTLKSFGWNNKFRLSDHWLINADLSKSDATHDFRVLETYAGLVGTGTTTTRVQLDPSGLFNQITFGANLNEPNNLRLIDAGGWGQDGYLKDFEVTDKLHALRLDATRSFDDGFISSFAFGLNVSDRTKSKTSDEAKLCLVSCTVRDSAAFPGTAGDFSFGGLEGLATYDANALLESGTYHLQPKFHRDIAAKNWSVDEKLTTLYAQANIDTDVGSMPLRGNFGFQYVTADQNSEGFSTFSGNDAGSPDKDGAKYSNFLPSLNLGLELSPGQFLRFGAAKQMARPRMDQMRATMDVGICDTCGTSGGPIWSAGGGNAKLRPWLAKAYDLSWEKYFTTDAGNKGYVSLAYFFKNLETYIYNQDVPFDFTGFPLPARTPTQTNYPATLMGKINQPTNGTGGELKGKEVTVSVPLDVIWGRLNGFGIQASYSDTTSSIHPNGPGTSEPISGLSKYVSNFTGYYERNGFSVRFSRRSRSAFRAETRGFGADLTTVDFNGEVVKDAQVNYNFNEGYLKGLGLYLQVSNIGDTPSTTADSGDRAARPVQYFSYGRTTLLGFSYKF